MPVRQLAEAGDDGIRAAFASVVDRATAEGREAGPENHARIEQVGIGDNPFAQAGNRLVDHRQYQSILEIGRHGCAVRRRLDCLAVFPPVIAVPRLATQATLLDEFVDLRRRHIAIRALGNR